MTMINKTTKYIRTRERERERERERDLPITIGTASPIVIGTADNCAYFYLYIHQVARYS